MAHWDGDELTLYEATQWVVGARNTVAETLGMPEGKVHIVSPFIGSGFGCKGFIWPHSVMSPIAAKKVGRPVKLNLTRKQMFSGCGHRSETRQKVSLGASPDGRVSAINQKNARSQAYRGIIRGIGMALMEHIVYDHRDGGIITSNLADYAVPVNPDGHAIDVHFIDQPDPSIDPVGIGARGAGEIPVTGVAPAIANAIYHATGKRIRELPITPDKLL